MSLDPQLLEILACPDTHHAPLNYDRTGQTLTCTECGRIFEIRDGIPVLLLDEARGGPASATQPGGDQPGGDQPGGDQPGGDQPGGDQPGGDQPGGDRPGARGGEA